MAVDAVAVARPFDVARPSLADFWRSIILFGRNTASYKFALGKSLLEIASDGAEVVPLERLAEPFSRHLCEHLRGVDRQATSPKSRFLDVCRSYNAGDLTDEVLRSRTAELGFVNVIDAFHVVNSEPTPVRFFVDERKRSGGIRLTDELLGIAGTPEADVLVSEVEARWRLVETAWELNMPRHLISVTYEPDTEVLLVEDGQIRRRPVTACRPALNGYQRGRCFYCRERLTAEDDGLAGDVDHFLPWSLAQAGFPANLDGVWNLVLACRRCNRGEDGKSSRLPAVRFLDRLHTRNEYLVRSHHPLRETLMRQAGLTEPDRARFLQQTYREAGRLLIHVWEPLT